MFMDRHHYAVQRRLPVSFKVRVQMKIYASFYRDQLKQSSIHVNYAGLIALVSASNRQRSVKLNYNTCE